MLNEFHEYISRGHAIDMAIGMIMGAAFTTIVNSLVKDMIMLPIGLIFGGVDFSNLFIALDGGTYATLKDAQAAGALTLNYGTFVSQIISFLIIAIAVLMLMRNINRSCRKREEASAAPPAVSRESVLLEEIRDLLKNG